MAFEQFEVFTFISDYKNVYCDIFVVFLLNFKHLIGT